MGSRQIYIAVVFAALVTSLPAQAADLYVRSSLTFAGALAAVRPGYEAAKGDTLHTVASASDPADLLILQRANFDPLVKDGKVDQAALTNLAQVKVWFAVKAGAPVPDISTPDKLKAVLLAAKSIGLSSAASGQYVSGEVFPKLGIADEVKAKTKPVTGAVGEAIARGEVEVGFQQMSELLPVKGVKVVGRIPEALQRVTIVTAGEPKDAKSPDVAARFVAYVRSPAAGAALKSMDLALAK